MTESTFKGMNDHDLLVYLATKQEDRDKEIAQIHEDDRDRDRKIDSAHSRISKQRIVNMSLSAVFGAVGGFFGGMFKGST